MKPVPARPRPWWHLPRYIIARYAALLALGRRWILATTLLFFACTVGGVLGGLSFPEANQQLIQRVGEMLAPALEALRGGDNWRAIGLIYWNNLRAMLLIMGTGALVFPLAFGLPLLAIGFNGYVLGVVLVLSGQPLDRVLASLVPHAIFELPALFIAGAWSLRMGITWLLPAAAGRRLGVWGDTVAEGLWIVPLIALLLAVAALIEVLISAPLTRAVVG
jgi:stage II sporulation protein M